VGIIVSPRGENDPGSPGAKAARVINQRGESWTFKEGPSMIFS
jgi:hypothetical protein